MRADYPGKDALVSLLISPMIIPQVITGIAIYYVFFPVGLVGAIPGLVLAHSLVALPIVTITLAANLRNFDVRLERAARVLGASAFQAFWHVTFPIIRPGVDRRRVLRRFSRRSTSWSSPSSSLGSGCAPCQSGFGKIFISTEPDAGRRLRHRDRTGACSPSAVAGDGHPLPATNRVVGGIGRESRADGRDDAAETDASWNFADAAAYVRQVNRGCRHSS